MKRVTKLFSYLTKRTRKVHKPETEVMLPHGTVKLLQLPYEIRQHIYEAVTALSASDHISLLCTSRQIYYECAESFFRRPLVCESQSHLITFTSRHRLELLENIEHLQMRLEELDPAVMQPFLALRVMGLPVKSHEHPYYQEGQRIVTSLQKLPCLRHLAILPPREQTRNVSSESVLAYVMEWVEKNYPNLASLNLSIQTVSLQCLSGFQNLRSLHFSGFSHTKPEETLRLLNRTRLGELIVVGPSEGLRWRQSFGYGQRVTRSITPDVLAKLNPLKNFTLCELSNAETPAFLTRAFLKALYDGHRGSLQELHLSAATTPGLLVQEVVVAFVMNMPNIRNLTFAWPNIAVDILDCLPIKMQRLQVAVHSNVHAQDVMNRLIMIEYRLPYLRKIKFNLVNPVHQAVEEGAKEEVGFAMPMQAISTLLRVPWTVSWGVWQPANVGS